MTASPISHVPEDREKLDIPKLRRQGFIAGLVGAGLMAAWFLALDTLRGHPLLTPTLLAHVLLAGSAGTEIPEVSRGSIVATVMFTGVHALGFAAIGLLVTEFLHRFNLIHNRAASLVLMLVALGVAFGAFALMFPAVGAQLSLSEAFMGNLIAAVGMVGVLGYLLGRED